MNVKSVGDNEASFTWTTAVLTGGRSDVFYRLGYRLLMENTYTFFDPPTRIIGTNGTISGLSPATTYHVVVVTENGVSFENPKIFPSNERMSNEVVVATSKFQVTIILMLLANSITFCCHNC